MRFLALILSLAAWCNGAIFQPDEVKKAERLDAFAHVELPTAPFIDHAFSQNILPASLIEALETEYARVGHFFAVIPSSGSSEFKMFSKFFPTHTIALMHLAPVQLYGHYFSLSPPYLRS